MYEGDKVRLRAYEADDIEKAHAYINDPELKHFLTPGIPFPLTLEDEKKFIEGISAFKDNYSFAIETMEGEYIGGCGMNNVDWKNSVATIGIFIGAKGYWGKGFGTDALKILINFIFNEMNINKIALNVYSFNERAIKSYEKCGFKVEGTLRQALYKNGQYYDDIIMGLLRDEYKK